MAERPVLYQLLEEKLGEPLAGYVTTLRADERSWRYITRKLHERTGVTISHETIRTWFTDEVTAA